MHESRWAGRPGPELSKASGEPCGEPDDTQAADDPQDRHPLPPHLIQLKRMAIRRGRSGEDELRRDSGCANDAARAAETFESHHF
jgi:hypothetical protein